jgi:hypothetical protein
MGEGEEGTPTSFGVIGSDRGGGRGAVARGWRTEVAVTVLLNEEDIQGGVWGLRFRMEETETC